MSFDKIFFPFAFDAFLPLTHSYLFMLFFAVALILILLGLFAAYGCSNFAVLRSLSTENEIKPDSSVGEPFGQHQEEGVEFEFRRVVDPELAQAFINKTWDPTVFGNFYESAGVDSSHGIENATTTSSVAGNTIVDAPRVQSSQDLRSYEVIAETPVAGQSPNSTEDNPGCCPLILSKFSSCFVPSALEEGRD